MCVIVRLLHCKMRIYNMFCALWFCDCAILLSIALRDNDIKIQRRHIKLEKDELERQLATNDPAGTEATELFSAEFHPNVAINTENGVAKTH